MRKYILVRALYSLVTLWLLVTIIFAMVRLTGDPVKMKGEVGADAVYLAAAPAATGAWTSPFHQQYASFIGNLLRGDFGHSFEKSLPVRDIYFERLPNSLKLGFAAFVISIVLGVPLGMLSALKVEHVVGQRRQDDRPARAVHARVLRRPGPDHHLRRRAGLASRPGQGEERVRLEQPLDLGHVLVPGLALPGHARLCAGLVLLGRHAAHHPLGHARRPRQRLHQARPPQGRARADGGGQARVEEFA